MTWSLWMTAAAVLIVIEIMTPGAFFFACLGLGAFLAGITALAGFNHVVCWSVFAAGSLTSIYFIRPLAKRFFQPKVYKSNIDELIGKKAFVTETINPPELGLVKVNGEVWRAESDVTIESDCPVEILEVSGTKVKVKRIGTVTSDTNV